MGVVGGVFLAEETGGVDFGSFEALRGGGGRGGRGGRACVRTTFGCNERGVRRSYLRKSPLIPPPPIRHTIIPNHRTRQRQQLPRVTRISQTFGVTDHAGGEDDFTGDGSVGTEGGAGDAEGGTEDKSCGAFRFGVGGQVLT